MAGPRRKKFESGEGSQYITRARALKMLQLSLKDFRRLCILKGIYPREPRNRKRAQRGGTGIRTLYNKKDIRFLLHEPIIWKFREQKVIGRKIGRAKALGDRKEARHLMNKPVQIQLDHIVKERYPTFIDALRDLDDCLTLCHLFSTFPSLKHVPRDQSSLCRRLILEFMQVVIHCKALRKVFVSIKGYYFQVELRGQTITWIMPHQFSFEPQTKEEVDFRIMSTFVQFYIVLLGFVNFRLYHLMNLNYPPKVKAIKESSAKHLVDKLALQSERIAALNYPLVTTSSTTTVDEEVALDEFQMESGGTDMEKAYAEAEKIKKLKTLFAGLKVFLNREVPREPLVFVLRCFGAEVSWDNDFFVGATFSESDDTITHHIFDTPYPLPRQYLSRYYVQPQWVFDSVNARELLPVEKYFFGVVLPPHLSPFVDATKDQAYHPPEEKEMFGVDNDDVESDKTVKDDKMNQPLANRENVDEISNSTKPKKKKNKVEVSVEEAEKVDDSDTENPEDLREKMKKKMLVLPGQVEKPDPIAEKRKEREEFKLREKMVQKKHKALYKSMMKGRMLRAKDVKVLQKKRRVLDQKKAVEV